MSMLAVTLLLPSRRASGADEPALKTFEQTYSPEIRPMLQRFCQECHSANRTEADIDLSEFVALADLRKNPQTWQKVGEMLDSGQMPPKKAKQQPTVAERTRLQEWVRGYLTVEARVHAGDPGRVVLRRLSNAEYTYTLRDLTGVDSLDPAREFPVDGAAGEGFTNTGNALVMSPALRHQVSRRRQGGRRATRSSCPTGSGSRRTTRRATGPRRSWRRSVSSTASSPIRRAATKVNLQGIVFDTNQGGRLPLEKYLAATIAERECSGPGEKSVEAVARRAA